MLCLLAPSRGEQASGTSQVVVSRKDRVIEGWRISVDDRLLAAPAESTGSAALAYLAEDLRKLSRLLAPEPLAALQSVRIVLDLDHGSLRSMQYHPSADWLRQNGYAPELAKCVHIPVAEGYTAERHRRVQPWCVLHELAHACHDQVLGFAEPRIRRAWENYVQSGHGDHVLHVNGRRVRHYALTDHKEFFAEMSESYFGTNDFFPFNQAELRESEPAIAVLLEEIWGKLPPL